MSVSDRKRCVNKHCREVLPMGQSWALCPSCAYIGRRCFWLGSVLAGIIVGLVSRWHR